MLNDFTEHMEAKKKKTEPRKRPVMKILVPQGIVEFCLEYLKSHTRVIESDQNINDLQPLPI